MNIIKYQLFDCVEENRLVIAPADHRDYWNRRSLAGTYAESWLDAKDRLGFELTATQKWLLDEQKRRAA